MTATTFARAVSQYVGDTTSDLFIRDVSKFPDLIKRTDYPLFSMVKKGDAPRQPKLKLEWGIRHIPPVNDTVTETLASEAGPSTMTPANIGYYQVGHIILFPGGEKVRVSAVGATTLTVVRAQAGTSTEALADNAGIRIIGIAVLENAESPIGTLTQGEIDYNYFQIFDKMHQMSNRARNTPTYEISDDRLIAWLNTTMEVEMPQYMENTLLWGTRALGSTTSPSYMGGAFQTSYLGTIVDLDGEILTEYQFLEGLQDAYNIVGSNNVAKTVMSHMFYKRVASNWTRDMQQVENSSKTRNLGVVDTYDTDFGRISWVTNHHMVSVNDPTLPDGRMLVFDPDDLTLRPYSNDSKWAIYAVYEGGWYSRRAVRGDYTLEAINPERRVAFVDLNTTAVDYPNFVS
jgi:hypothetical protein